MEHMEQVSPWSTQSSVPGAHGAAAVSEHLDDGTDQMEQLFFATTITNHGLIV